MEEFGLSLDDAVNAACNAGDAITSVDPEHMEQVFQEFCRRVLVARASLQTAQSPREKPD